MATLHGKKLTEKQYAALKKKWEREDNLFWKKSYQSEIKRIRQSLSKWKKLKAGYKNSVAKNIATRSIDKLEVELKDVQSKLKSL